MRNADIVIGAWCVQCKLVRSGVEVESTIGCVTIRIPSTSSVTSVKVWGEPIMIINRMACVHGEDEQG